MRRLPLVIAAGTAATLAAATVVVVMTLPGGRNETPPAVPASDTATPAGITADADTPSSATSGRGSDYWTPERMRGATPMPTPQISEEEYERLIGSKKKPEPQ